MRVPATLTEAKSLLETTDLKTLRPLSEGYRYLSVTSSYGGIKQRWLVIHSQAAQTRTKKRVAKQLLKMTEQERKAFEKLCRRAFACEQDAKAALEGFQHELKVLSVHDAGVVETPHYGKRGRPSQDSTPDRVSYHLQGALAAPLHHYQEQLARASLFILASNELDTLALSDEDILSSYKAQKVERGFRFLKDPMFLASTLFLKKVQRVMALLMVMTVCLLVYAALEHRIRGILKARQASLPDQKGKATQRPTARWVFELFLDVHLLHIVQDSIQTLTMNLKDELKTLLKLLGSAYREAYP
jgi:transposase